MTGSSASHRRTQGEVLARGLRAAGRRRRGRARGAARSPAPAARRARRAQRRRAASRVRLAERGLEVAGIDISRAPRSSWPGAAAAERGVDARFERGDVPRAAPRRAVRRRSCAGATASATCPTTATDRAPARPRRRALRGRAARLVLDTHGGRGRAARASASEMRLRRSARSRMRAAPAITTPARSRLARRDPVHGARLRQLERGAGVHHVYTVAELVRMLGAEQIRGRGAARGSRIRRASRARRRRGCVVHREAV